MYCVEYFIKFDINLSVSQLEAIAALHSGRVEKGGVWLPGSRILFQKIARVIFPNQQGDNYMDVGIIYENWNCLYSRWIESDGRFALWSNDHNCDNLVEETTDKEAGFLPSPYAPPSPKIVNATPHTIHILGKTGVTQDPKTKTYSAVKAEVEVLQTISTSGIVPRVQVSEQVGDAIAGIPTESLIYGEIENLPDPEEGIFYIVSSLVATAAKVKGRTDCLSPSKLVRDRDNSKEVLGCLALGR